MIWLAGKDKDDLKKIPLKINRRLEVRPNLGNEVYEFRKNLIHYILEKEIPEFSRYGHNIAESVGRVGKIEHFFRSSENITRKLYYWEISVWDKVPPEYRDIVFFHELKEMEHMTYEIFQPEAHKLARRAELSYISKYLNSKEQIDYLKWSYSVRTLIKDKKIKNKYKNELQKARI